jgi:drug/metabolite transporter (DMT)-like permease
MSPIVAGICAALSFAISVLVSARASRRAGAPVTVAGSMLVGLVIVLPIALLVTPLPATSQGTLLVPSVAGVANVTGLLLAYTAYTIGAVGIVSTIASTEGAIAALISVLAGQQLAPGSGPLLALVAVGVVLAATGGGQEVEEGVRIGRARSLRAAGLAALAATMFGTNLYLTGSVSGDLPIAWLLLPGRVLGVLVVGVPLLLAGRASIPRTALPFIVTCGIVEVTGTTAFAIGAQVDIAVTSVLASMFAPIAAIAAFVLFGERLARRQVVGIALVVAGIGLLGAAAGASRITG